VKKILIPLFISVSFFLCMRMIYPSPHTLAKAFFKNYGFEISETVLESAKITLPSALTPVYENYNRIQALSGMDISPYLGKTVRRYTYAVLNFPFETNSPVRANVLIYKGKIIAADLMTVNSDGFMLSPADPIFSLDKM